jgi:hypothetical protein
MNAYYLGFMALTQIMPSGLRPKPGPLDPDFYSDTGWRKDKLGSKTHKTAVVIIPPEALWAPIQAVRKEHDRQFRRRMPHISLIYPFRPKPLAFVVSEVSMIWRNERPDDIFRVGQFISLGRT